MMLCFKNKESEYRVLNCLVQHTFQSLGLILYHRVCFYLPSAREGMTGIHFPLFIAG